MAECPAFVIIRYGIGRHQSCKNSLTKWLSVHNNYTGKVAGLSDTIQCLEGHWSHDKGIAVLHFESVRDAERWTHCTPEIKQHDWLDSVDMIVVPVADLPRQGYNYVQVLDIDFGGCRKNFESFQADHSKDASAFMEEAGACGGVVATKDVKKIRGLWEPNYLVLNFWSSAEQFQAAVNSEKYEKLTQARQNHSNANVCIFKMENLIKQC